MPMHVRIWMRRDGMWRAPWEAIIDGKSSDQSFVHRALEVKTNQIALHAYPD